jgi:hypothetical protein
MVGQAEVHVEVDENKPLTDVELLLLEIEMEVRSKVPIIEKASIIPHSSSLSKSRYKKIPHSSSLSKSRYKKMDEWWKNI